MNDKYEVTIGIETHVQLATKTKLFSGADNDARDKQPNTVVSPVDYALPGMLPVLNKKAIELAIKAGFALNAEIARISRFDRKHYFYPDLPKGYQTTQMYQPIIGAGSVIVPQTDGSEKTVRIHHAHLEEDAGKLTHHGTYSLVDLNRAGTPLIEIVSEPDIHSSEEAKAYGQELYKLMTYAGVTNGDLYHGNMRFDVNVSIAPKGSKELGKRAEVKNLNSFKSIERAVEYEIKRQSELLDKGERVVQETRGWDEDSGKTTSQRSKEDAQDYRYMPDADIPPIVLNEDDIKRATEDAPKLPGFYRKSWADMQLDHTVINALLLSQDAANVVERIKQQADTQIARRVALWLIMALKDEPSSEMSGINSNKDLNDDYLIELAKMTDKNELNSTAAKEVFFAMLSSQDSPRKIATDKNLLQISNSDEISEIVKLILEKPENQKAVEDIKSGNDKVIGFLVGQVMKQSGGKANPSMAQDLIRKTLTEL